MQHHILWPARQEYWSGLIFLTQRQSPGILHCRRILYHPSHQGSPLTHCHTDHTASPDWACVTVATTVEWAGAECSHHHGKLYWTNLRWEEASCSSFPSSPCHVLTRFLDCLLLWSGRSPGEENGYPLQYSCLESPMIRGTWQATVHGVAKRWTRLSD